MDVRRERMDVRWVGFHPLALYRLLLELSKVRCSIGAKVILPNPFFSTKSNNFLGLKL
jgi:hypothetical protein